MKKDKFTAQEIEYFNDYYNPKESDRNYIIIDDNCYLNGKSVTFDFQKDYIIVIGGLGIGKSTYSKIMSKYNKDIQYYSEQRLETIHRAIRDRSIKIIDIREVRI